MAFPVFCLLQLLIAETFFKEIFSHMEYRASCSVFNFVCVMSSFSAETQPRVSEVVLCVSSSTSRSRAAVVVQARAFDADFLYIYHKNHG
jgi:type II secretory pathway component PulK